MNAYHVQDRIEAQREFSQLASIEQESWIDARAKEIIALAPERPCQMAAWTDSALVRAMYHEKSIEAYNEFISAAAYAQAEYEWEHRSGCPF
ncbi:host nuclease inhibitor GamL [Escherichia coli]|nr:host nuclease inhibitor GamL [Escherichia coli]